MSPLLCLSFASPFLTSSIFIPSSINCPKVTTLQQLLIDEQSKCEAAATKLQHDSKITNFFSTLPLMDVFECHGTSSLNTHLVIITIILTLCSSIHRRCNTLSYALSPILTKHPTAARHWHRVGQDKSTSDQGPALYSIPLHYFIKAAGGS